MSAGSAERKADGIRSNDQTGAGQWTCFPSKWPLKHRWRKWRPPLSILIILPLMEEGAFRFSPCGNNQSNYGILHCTGVWSDCWPGVMSFCREAASASLSCWLKPALQGLWGRLIGIKSVSEKEQANLHKSFTAGISEPIIAIIVKAIINSLGFLQFSSFGDWFY